MFHKKTSLRSKAGWFLIYKAHLHLINQDVSALTDWQCWESQ